MVRTPGEDSCGADQETICDWPDGYIRQCGGTPLVSVTLAIPRSAVIHKPPSRAGIASRNGPGENSAAVPRITVFLVSGRYSRSFSGVSSKMLPFDPGTA